MSKKGVTEEKRTVNPPRILIAAAGSGSGKTMLTCALLAALKERGLSVRAFKCGPDYIDPMFHREVIGVPSRNLDTFFSDEEQVQELFSEGAKACDISVVEGVMGLYDGLGGIETKGSAYDLACTLKMPVILVVDAHGMGRSLLPLIAGFLQYDTEKRICGIILNRVTEHFYQTIAPLIEKELKISVLGFFPQAKDIAVESRHLGLKLPEEIEGLKAQTKKAAELLTEHISLEKVLAAAKQKAEPFSVCIPETKRQKQTVKIGIAKDAAFCFYYEDNLRLLSRYGAELIPFSPLSDKKLPEGIQGLILGGGYPELYAKELEANGVMRNAIRNAVQKKMPVIAECGGFMYLHGELVDEEENAHAMCGVLQKKCVYKGKLVRFGYVEVREKQPHFLKEGACILGHEFHYYDSEDNGADCVAKKPVSGKSWDCVHETDCAYLGFPHLYYPSNPAFVRHFVETAMRYEISSNEAEMISFPRRV